MSDAKSIILRPITAQEANTLVKRVHYSGKVVNNSQIHIGVFYNGKLEGAMQFGPSLDKRKMLGLVNGTLWNEFIELNRMAFSDVLPRNSESRALSIAFKLLRKHAPQLKWVVSFADATQCGDGTIYRASGFVLTGIKKNDQIWVAPDESNARFSRTSLTDGRSKKQQGVARAISRGNATKGNNILENGSASMKPFIEAGFTPMSGFQLRYIYFLDPSYRQHLTVPVIPFSKIDEMGAGMYKGEKREHAVEVNGVTSGDQSEKGGSSPTQPLKVKEL